MFSQKAWMLRSLFSMAMVAGCCIIANGATITYTADNTTIFPNPERGWRAQAQPPCCDNPPGTINGPHAPLTVSQLQAWRNSADAITVFKDDVKIQQWTSDIPQSRLDQIDADLATVRQAGLKQIFRIVYNWGMDSQSPLEPQILRHIQQLKPIIAKNEDVIFAFEFGTLGGCGEAVSGNYIDGGGNNGAQRLTPAAIRIYNAIAAMVPVDRMLPIHYPRYKCDMMGWTNGSSTWPGAATTITTANAFDGSLQSRIGFYDDNFAGDANHWGFFYGWPAQEKALVENDGLYVVTEGELSGATAYNEQNGESELKRYRFTAYQQTGDGGATVIAAWKSSGQYDRIARDLGYRFRLATATLPDALKPGTTFDLTMSMANDGYTRIMNARKVEIILRNQSGGARYVLNVDNGKGNRLWLPGPSETKTLTVTGGIPASMPTGSYDVILNLPDPYPSIHDRPEYSIRLANTNVWESSTGYNKMNHTLQISASGGGAAYAGSSWFALNGVTLVSHQTVFPLIRPDASYGAASWYSLNGKQLTSAGSVARTTSPRIVIKQTMVNGRKVYATVVSH
jgi:hypothetical protein